MGLSNCTVVIDLVLTVHSPIRTNYAPASQKPSFYFSCFVSPRAGAFNTHPKAPKMPSMPRTVYRVVFVDASWLVGFSGTFLFDLFGFMISCFFLRRCPSLKK